MKESIHGSFLKIHQGKLINLDNVISIDVTNDFMEVIFYNTRSYDKVGLFESKEECLGFLNNVMNLLSNQNKV